MSNTYYLMSIFDDTLKEILPGGTGANAILSGEYAIRIPSSDLGMIPFAGIDASTVLGQKYTGILASYAGFSNIAFDGMLDATGVDTVNSNAFSSGLKGANSVFSYTGLPGYLQTLPAVLASTPTQAIFTWEAFSYSTSDFSNFPLGRTYQEQPASSMTCQVSFNGGSTWISVLDGVLFTISGPNQGSSFIAAFTSGASVGQRIYLGSWALVY